MVAGLNLGKPRLSLVLTGRNDDHGGDFAARLFRAADHNRRLLAAAGIDFEYVWVEWNPVAGKPLLADEVVARIPEARAYVAGPEIHQAYCSNPHMTIMEFIAKNAGIRRAAGEWVLTTNADILLDRPIVQCMAALRHPGAATIHRAVRHDLAPGAGPADLTNPSKRVATFHTTPPYHGEASGDFLLASNRVYHALRGFNETIRYAKLHKDTQFCAHAVKLGFQIDVIGEVFHLYHANSWMNFPSDQRERADAPWGRPYNYLANLPYLNPPRWGLVDFENAPISERIHQLVGSPTTLAAARQASELAPPTDPLTEAASLLAARGDEFESAFVATLAGWLRARPDPAAPMVALLRRYVKLVWERLADNPAVRDKGVAIYGAGRHTRWLLGVLGDDATPSVRVILDDAATGGASLAGIPVVRPSKAPPDTFAAIVLSSDIHETKLAARAHEVFGDAIPVVQLYDQLPAGLYLLDPSGVEPGL